MASHRKAGPLDRNQAAPPFIELMTHTNANR